MAGPYLAGRRIVVTRAEAQADALTERLEARGADVLTVPAIAVVPLEDDGPVRAAAAALAGADWLVFTSANGVAHSRAALDAAWPGGLPRNLRVAAIGPGTAEACAEAGWSVAFLPPAHVSESLAATLPVDAGQRVVVLQAARARDVLAEGLRARGAHVDAVAAYDTRVGAEPDQVRAALTRTPDALTFTSASTVDGFAAGLENTPWPSAPSVAIGPVTADALARHGVRAAAVAQPHTLDGLVDALVTLFA